MLNDVLHNPRGMHRHLLIYSNLLIYSVCVRPLCVLENGGMYQNVTAASPFGGFLDSPLIPRVLKPLLYLVHFYSVSLYRIFRFFFKYKILVCLIFNKHIAYHRPQRCYFLSSPVSELVEKVVLPRFDRSRKSPEFDPDKDSGFHSKPRG